MLRVLESGEIRPVGDNDAKTVDVRVLCATHRNLEEMSASGDFREDLMFRINTFEIALPSLRERIDDIPRLAASLYCRFNKSAKIDEELFSPEAIEALQSHTWPGNVRELANVIEHATILCDKPPILPEHLPRRFDSRKLIGAASSASGGAKGLGPIALRDLEMQAIYEALDRHEGNKPKAADELGISLKTLYNKLNQSTPLAKSA
jgi:two-component system NtrC family response regulator